MKTKAQILAYFSEKKLISQSTATNITNALYGKGLDIKSLDRIMWRLEEFIRRDKMPAIMDLLSVPEIESVIDEMVAEDEKWKAEALNHGDNGTKLSQNFTAWGFSEFAEKGEKTYKAGDIIDIQIMRVGKWNHPAYGEFEVTTDTLTEIKTNFDTNLRGIDLAVDENHEPNHKALAWYKELYQVAPTDLYAKLELTQKGADLLNEGAYRYFSPEIVFFKTDEETGKPITNMLVGGAFTNRPFFKSMQPLMASEDGQETGGTQSAQGEASHGYSDNFYIFFDPTMKTLLELLAQFSELAKINAAQKTQLTAAFSAVPAESISTEITAAYNEMLAKFSEDDGAGAGDQGAGDDKGDEGKGGDDEGAGEPATPKTVALSEGMVAISASELAALQATATKAKEDSAKAFSELCENTIGTLVFSETNLKGSILPKNREKVSAFAKSLGSQKAGVFFEILKEIRAFSTEEIGSSGGVPTDTSKSVNEQKFSEAVKFYQETLGFSEADAKEAATAAFAQAK